MIQSAPFKKNLYSWDLLEMNVIWISLLVALGLAVDCFSVSLCIGSSPKPLTPRAIFRLAFHFGLFQGGMTYLGWLFGVSVANYVAKIDHWIAFSLLMFIGGKMILEGLQRGVEKEVDLCTDQTRGISLVILSIATSIDAFGVGLSYAFIDSAILDKSLLIGLTSFIFTIAGLFGGRKISDFVGTKAEIFGGLVLIFIGVRIVLIHTGIFIS